VTIECSWNWRGEFALFNWNNHLIIRAFRSITVRDVDGRTVRLIFGQLFALFNVVWSENDNKLTLSKTPQSDKLVVEDDVVVRLKLSDCNRSSCSYS